MPLNHKTDSELKNIEQHFSLKADRVGTVVHVMVSKGLIQRLLFSFCIHQVAGTVSGGQINRLIGKFIS